LVAALLCRELKLKLLQVQADTVWQDAPVTVHAFLQHDSESLEPALKKQCSTVEVGGSGRGVNGPRLVFYVRMADHAGKFDVERAKAFALVPRLHYTPHTPKKKPETLYRSQVALCRAETR
jgi:hypothetical protein